MALLDTTWPEKYNIFGFWVIGHTMCSLNQCELSFASFLFTLYIKAKAKDKYEKGTQNGRENWKGYLYKEASSRWNPWLVSQVWSTPHTFLFGVRWKKMSSPFTRYLIFYFHSIFNLLGNIHLPNLLVRSKLKIK
jgi:hypothetical protein